MDPFSADIIAGSRRQEMAEEAEASRTACAARDCQEEPGPEPRPRTVRARRAALG